MLFVHLGGGGGVKINIVKFVWGSILNLLKFWGESFPYTVTSQKIFPAPLLVNNDVPLRKTKSLYFVPPTCGVFFLTWMI